MAEARKTITIVFSDVAGSTSLGERLDPEAARKVMERYFSEARAAMERHGGTVEKFIGDAVMAVFGIPAAHEDDALRAVRAAAELCERLEELNRELEAELGVSLAIRTGINTGEVVVGDPASGQFYATGDAVNVAARLEQAAAPGEILIGEETYRLVRDAVRTEAVEPLRLKGKANLVSAQRLVEVVEGAPSVARRFETPLVGRADQMAHLVGTFERSVVEQAPVLVTVFGAAGIGKTRLAGEFAANVAREAQVLHGRCLSYGEGITFWPLREILRSLPARPPDVPRPEDATSVEETFWAYRKLFESLARERPLLVVVEDIHWAEPTLLDVIEHIVEWTHDVPMMFLCLARPELMDSRPGWPGERIELEPLGKSEAQTLVQELGGALDSESQERAITVAEGNPLFIEQMLAFAADEEPGDVHVPQTIQALLATRLDQLEPDERRLVEAAAVVGKEFWRNALLFLSPSGAEVSPLLQRLVRRRLIQPERSSLPGEDAFRFGHILIREAAYAGIPKERRAALHERFADWLDDLASPYEEIIGYHLERAHGYRTELGTRDASIGALKGRAGRTLASAGRRAFHRGDMSAAANLLQRSCSLLEDRDSVRLEALISLGTAFFSIAQPAKAEAALAEVIQKAEEHGNEALLWRARLDATYLRGQFDPTGAFNEDMEREAQEAVSVFERLENEQGLGRAWRQIAQARNWALRLEAAEEAAQRAAEFARRAGDRHEEGWALRLLTGSLSDGPTPVPEAIKRCNEILTTAEHDLELRAGVLRALAWLYSLQGDLKEARCLVDEAVQICEERGLAFRLAVVLGYTRPGIDFAEGNKAAAEADLRRSFELFDGMGEKGSKAGVAAALAHFLAKEGRDSEAMEFIRVSEATNLADDWGSQAVIWAARAHLRAAGGDFDQAAELARSAVSLLDKSDTLAWRAFYRTDVAELLALGGDVDGAARLVEEAAELYERKGATSKARLARERLEGLQAGAHLPTR